MATSYSYRMCLSLAAIKNGNIMYIYSFYVATLGTARSFTYVDNKEERSKHACSPVNTAYNIAIGSPEI